MKRWALPAMALALTLSPAAAPAAAGTPQAEARALLGQLVAIRSAQGQGKVPLVADALAARFRAAGFATEDIRTLPVQAAGGERTVALIVRYRADASSAARPLVLLGHMDVVDADPALWSVDPFQLTEKQGYWYGRGTADNKGQVAAIATTLMRLKRSGWVPQREILLALSGDEESGSRTTRALTADPWLRRAEYAINGDTGGGEVDADGGHPVFDLQVAEKTSVSFKLSSRNRGGHSSIPRPDNALYAMADAIKAVQALRFPVRIEPSNRGMVEGLAKDRAGELGAAFAALLANPADAAARAVVERHPDDAHVLSTTCVPTMIQGGSARNALPESVETIVHCRIFPGDATADVQAALTAAIGNPAVAVAVDAARGSSPPSPPRRDLFEAASQALRGAYPNAELRYSMSSGGSDNRYFREAGIPSYGVSPLAEVRPVDDRAHGTDERLRVEALDKALVFWDGFLRRLAGAQAIDAGGQVPRPGASRQ